MNAKGEQGKGPDRSGFAGDLLAWYDREARSLPWRSPPGTPPPGPYEALVAEVMLQQTTVATVRPRYERFLSLFPTVQALADAPLDAVLAEWAGLGYYARARNLHACARVVAADGWPRTEEGLRALPGLGAYTAASLAAIAFGEPAVVVDGNVERVITRLFAIEAPIRSVRPELRRHAATLTPAERAGDYAQAMMDLGATICRPRTPECLLCPVRRHCDAAATGLAEELPVRAPKRERPVRHGIVYVGLRGDGAVLCERRPPEGLYGGMSGLPSSAWAKVAGPASPSCSPPYEADWREVGTAEHGLTHFVLSLRVVTAAADRAPPGLFFVPPTRHDALPTVFRRCLSIAQAASSA